MIKPEMQKRVKRSKTDNMIANNVSSMFRTPYNFGAGSGHN